MIAGRPLALAALVIGAAVAAEAQPLGTFQWQLEPYCHVLTLSITRSGEIYRVEGFDDQCGGERASVIGTAFPGAGGHIALGMSIVTAPGATPVHVRATLGLPSLSGAWQDSGGLAGTMVPTTAPASGGARRPAHGMGAAVVNPAAVQRRIRGHCAAGQFIAGIDADGFVSCTGAGGGTITRVMGGTGVLGIGGPEAASLYFHPNSIETVQGVVARASASDTGPGPIQGQGRFFAWHAGKGAFRAGQVLFYPGQWNDTTTGNYSVGMGRDARASGAHSTALGDAAIADAQYSVALNQGFARGLGTVALGRGYAVGDAALAAGLETEAHGPTTVALGTNVEVPYQVPGSFVFGDSRTLANQRMVGGANQFNVRADAYVEFFSDAAATVGVRLDAGSWESTSDRRLKAHIRPLSGERVLSRLARLPIREWNYTAEDPGIRHLGPSAQDFRAAFGLGESPRHISTVDADGIVLSALQAIEARTRTIAAAQRVRRGDTAKLCSGIERLEARVRRLAP